VDEVRRGPVGEGLDLRLPGLGFLDRLNGLLDRRIRPDPRRLDDEYAVLFTVEPRTSPPMRSLRLSPGPVFPLFAPFDAP
jgi:hypothetical protein